MNGKNLSAQNWVLGGGAVHCIRICPKNDSFQDDCRSEARLVKKLPGFHGEISEFYWKIHWKIQVSTWIPK